MEKFSEANSLLSVLPQELEERGRYLINNRQMRLDYSALKDRLNAWVKDAESRLGPASRGIDFEHVVRDLEEHRAFFGGSGEAAVRDLVSQQLQKGADLIWPSLTGSEQEEIGREQQHHLQLLKNTLNSARSRSARLEQGVEVWHDYCAVLEKVRAALLRADFSDEPVTTLAGLHFNVQKLEHAMVDTRSQQPEVDLLNERMREIVSQADTINKERIETEVTKINNEWVCFIDGLESRKDTLVKLGQHWQVSLKYFM